MASGVLCIVGMHRSGTSLLGRCLQLVGINFGRGALSVYFENVEMLRINEEILLRHGGSWLAPPVLTEGWHLNPELDDLRERARAYLDRAMPDDIAWGWKDPRSSFTAPFWATVIQRPLAYVVCVRNVLDVANSLKVRNNMSYKQSGDLWLSYTKAAMQHKPATIVPYEGIVRHPKHTCRKFRQWVGLASNNDIEKAFCTMPNTKARISSLKAMHDEPAFSDETKALCDEVMRG